MMMMMMMNVLAVGTFNLLLRCRLQARSARRCEAFRRPQREERGVAYCGGRPQLVIRLLCKFRLKHAICQP